MRSKIKYGTNESIIEPSSGVYRIQPTDDERKLSVEGDGHVLDLLIMSENMNHSFVRIFKKYRKVVRMKKKSELTRSQCILLLDSARIEPRLRPSNCQCPIL